MTQDTNRDATAHKRFIDTGAFVVHVEESSENTPLHADLMLK